MDSSAQDPNLQNVKGSQTSPVDDQKQPVATPVSTFNKESPATGVAEIVRPSEPEPNIPAEVASAGVEKTVERPKLEAIHEQIGVKYSGETAPVPTKPSGAVKLPMTESQAKAEVAKDKKLPVVSISEHGEEAGYIVPSKFFLATVVLKVIDRMKSIFKN